MNRRFFATLLALATCLLLSLGQAIASPSGVVISQVYGGGGNTGATLTNDFIELFNAGATPVSLNGWSVQYASSSGTSWQVTNLGNFTLQPGQYYLVQQAAGANPGTALPTPDAIGTIAMSGSTGKVALMRTTAALSGSSPIGNANLEDFVGYGGASAYEGSGPTGTLGNATAALRLLNGCTDTDVNSADFQVLAPNPRNHSTTLAPCGGGGGNQPIIASCTAFNTVSSIAGSSLMSASDADGIVNAASITSTPVPGISLGTVTAASAIGGSASARIEVAGSVGLGTYPITLDFSNNQSQSTSCSFSVTVQSPPASVTRIYTIQGTGATSPLVGTTVTTRGIVTAALPGLSGYFIQDETGDGNPLSSDGIFVYNGSSTLNVAAGERVQVTGTVTEFRPGSNTSTPTLTELSGITSLAKLGTGTIAATAVTFPEAMQGDFERYEGMLVTFASPLTVSQNYFQGRYGQVTLSAGGRLVKPTNQFRPGTAAALAAVDDNARRLIVLDDGTLAQNPNPIPFISDQNTLRAGDTVTNVVGVVDFGLISSDGATADYKIQSTATPTFTRVNVRTVTPPAVGGTLRVGSFNVLNYFTTFTNGQNAAGLTGQGCTLGGGTSASNCRGADTLTEFNRQRDKIVNAIHALDADIVGLMEIQNSSDVNGNSSAASDVAVQNLVDGLNAKAGSTLYSIVPRTTFIGTDAIRVAMIYKPSKVTTVGASLTDTDPIHNRPPLAQAFQTVTGNAKFSVIVNHFKSKSCSGATGADLDQGDGQGCYNDTRRKQATRMLTFISTVQQAAGDSDVLMIGDLNAYGQEDPIFTLTSGGLVDQVARFGGGAAYSYVFDGEIGYLDHALATASLSAQINGTAHWKINADEPSVIDYNTEFKPQDLYTSEPFRASDHDPVLIGLSLTGVLQPQTITFGVLADRLFGSGSFSVAATSTSALPVAFSSVTPLVCSVSGSTVALLAAGQCTIAADQPGDSTTWAPAPQVTRAFMVLIGTQSITFGTLPDVALGSAPVVLTGSASSGLPVAFSSGSPSVCSVNANQVSVTSIGLCIVRADQAGNGNYAAAPQVVRSFNVTAGNGNGDVPLPPWAYVALVTGLLSTALRRSATRQPQAPST